MFSAYKRVWFDHSILYSVVILFHYSINKKNYMLGDLLLRVKGKKKVKWSLKLFWLLPGTKSRLRVKRVALTSSCAAS